MALITAFRKYLQEAEEAESRDEETGISRYRRKLELMNRGKLVVFCGNHFGIFKNNEVMLLAGLTVRESALKGETVEGVLARYKITIDTS
jgi:hypothetical protein